jgi:hypothetical protein
VTGDCHWRNLWTGSYFWQLTQTGALSGGALVLRQ